MQKTKDDTEHVSPSPSMEDEEATQGAEIVNDQNRRGYYYDDAYGYEEYVPEDDQEQGGRGEGESAVKQS